MAESKSELSLLPGVITRGIPAVALLLGATACQDDPVYFYPDADTGTGGDTGTGTGGDTGTGTGGDTGTGTGGDTGTGDTGGDTGTGDTGGDTGTGDTGGDTGTGDTGGDTGTGDTDEPQTMEEVLRRFCVAKVECEDGVPGSDLRVLRCMGHEAYRLDNITYYYSTNAEVCLEAYLEVMNEPALASCEEYTYHGYYGDYSYMRFELDWESPALVQVMAKCHGLAPEDVAVIKEACNIVTDCEGTPENTYICVREGIWRTSYDSDWLAFFGCLTEEATCDEGSLSYPGCEEPTDSGPT